MKSEKTPEQTVVIEKKSDEKPQGILCEICGHINEPDCGICVMCSNYLFDQQRRKQQ